MYLQLINDELRQDISAPARRRRSTNRRPVSRTHLSAALLREARMTPVHEKHVDENLYYLHVICSHGTTYHTTKRSVPFSYDVEHKPVVQCEVLIHRHNARHVDACIHCTPPTTSHQCHVSADCRHRHVQAYIFCYVTTSLKLICLHRH